MEQRQHFADSGSGSWTCRNCQQMARLPVVLLFLDMLKLNKWHSYQLWTWRYSTNGTVTSYTTVLGHVKTVNKWHVTSYPTLRLTNNEKNSKHEVYINKYIYVTRRPPNLCPIPPDTTTTQRTSHNE